MEDEIKEILDRLERIDHKEYSCGFEFADGATFNEMARCFEERKKLANYITDLQEENKEANDSITWWTNRFNAVQRDYEDYKSRCEKLELENKILKEQMVAMVQPNYVYGIELQGVGKDE